MVRTVGRRPRAPAGVAPGRFGSVGWLCVLVLAAWLVGCGDDGGSLQNDATNISDVHADGTTDVTEDTSQPDTATETLADTASDLSGEDSASDTLATDTVADTTGDSVSDTTDTVEQDTIVAPQPRPTTLVLTSGGGSSTSSTHRIQLAIGAPQPFGMTTSSTHRLLLGPIVVH